MVAWDTRTDDLTRVFALREVEALVYQRLLAVRDDAIKTLTAVRDAVATNLAASFYVASPNLGTTIVGSVRLELGAWLALMNSEST
jgi:hypothetical protein